MSVDMQLQGIDEVIKRLEEMGSKANKVIEEALEEGAEPILKDAQNTRAFEDRSGKLRRALKKSKVKNRQGIKLIWVGDVDREVSYSWAVEYGNSRATARPFLRVAYARNKQEVQRIIKEKLREVLKV